MQWTVEQLDQIAKEVSKPKLPLYLFLNEDEKVLDCEWFENHAQAIAHARTLNAPLVNVLLYIGVADNIEEIFEHE